MGMMINRRRAYGGNATVAEYIQDGLIFHLDGKNLGEVEGYWTDLINGIKFPFNSGVYPNVSDGGVLFAPNHPMFKADSLLGWPDASCTLEICTSNFNNMLIFDSRGLQIALGVYSNYLIFGHGTAYDYSFVNEPSTYCVNKNNAYQNGIEKRHADGTWWSGGGDGITVGSRGSAMIFSGTIYEVRVYNRHLSQDEAYKNYLIDKERYNI